MSDERLEELMRRAAAGGKLNDTQAAELAMAIRGATLRDARGFAYGHWVVRGIAVLVLVVLVWFVPVTVYRCAPQGGGAASCAVESAIGGWSVESAYTVASIARAEPSPERDAVRFLDRRDQELYRSEPMTVVGTRMTTLARQVSALAEGKRTEPVVARQWPLVIAIIAMLAALFLVAQAASAIHAWRRRATGAKGDDNALGFAIALGMTLVGFGVLWLAPVVIYACQNGESGAVCAVETRLAGVLPIDRVEVDGIASANARSWTHTWTSTENGRTKNHSERRTSIDLVAQDGTLLYADEQSGIIGTRSERIAENVSGIVGSSTAKRFVAWQMPWIPAIFASILLLIGLPSVVAMVVGFVAVPRGPAYAVIGVATVVALIAGWVLALMGRLPS